MSEEVLTYLLSVLSVFSLCFVQNIAFTLTSRSRNRDNKWYHGICAVFSNGIYFATFGVILQTGWDWKMAFPYVVGTVAGSLVGADIAIKIENKIGAKT